MKNETPEGAIPSGFSKMRPSLTSKGVKVVMCTPTRDRPHQAYLDALEASVPFLDAAGYEHRVVYEIGCPYISGARATMLRKAMLWGADVFVFIDHDVSWAPKDLVTLIETPGDVVGGTYRFKISVDETYMGFLYTGETGRPLVREDGCIKAWRLPAGFLKVTRKAVERFMECYPHLVIDADKDRFKSPDLFNHGAYKGVWFGEDYAFCRNWIDAGGELWCIPDLNLDHNGKEKVWSLREGLLRAMLWCFPGLNLDYRGKDKAWKGNLHECLLRAKGGAKSVMRESA